MFPCDRRPDSRCLPTRSPRAVVTALAVVGLLGLPTRGLTQTPVGSREPSEAATTRPALTLQGEFRERLESTTGIGYADGRDDAFWLTRVRVTATARLSSWASLTGQVQDARVADKNIGSTGTPFSAPLDVRLAHVALGRETSPLALTAGRQELAFGEQRLVGHVSWANAARSFDGVRLTARRPGLQVDAFGTSVVRIRQREWDRGGFGSQFHGVHVAASRLIRRATVESYVLWRREANRPTEAGSLGDLSLGTVGARLAGQLGGGVEYASESVLQWGSVGAESQRAYAQHLRVRTPTRAPGVRAVAEYNYASGDRAPGDGRHGTFDTLFPTPHDKYGLADQVGWRNVHHIRVAFELPGTWLPLTAAYHSWWLASMGDGLYSAPGALIVPAAPDATGRHVGHSVDIQTARALTSHVRAAAGYAAIYPGRFLKDTTHGGTLHSLYLMLTISGSIER